MISLSGIFIGDCYGSPYEGKNFVQEHNRIGSYTDDTEQALAVALWLKSGIHTKDNLIKFLKQVYTGADRGYGRNQIDFLEGRSHRKDSYGNGASMRVAPIGEYCKDYKKVIELATLQSRITHNHPDAIAGAVTIALCVYLIKNNKDIKIISSLFSDAMIPIDDRKYICSLDTAESVPPAIKAFLEGSGFEDVLKRAFNNFGDTDTICAMACALAAMKYGIPRGLLEKTVKAHKDNEKIYKKIKSI